MRIKATSVSISPDVRAVYWRPGQLLMAVQAGVLGFEGILFKVRQQPCGKGHLTTEKRLERP